MAVRDFENASSESITVSISGAANTANGQEEFHMALLWKPESNHAGWIFIGNQAFFRLNPYSDGFLWFAVAAQFMQAAPYTVGEWNLAIMSIPAGAGTNEELRSHYMSLDDPGWTHENEGEINRGTGNGGMTSLVFGSNGGSEHLDGKLAVVGVWIGDAPWAPDSGGDATIEAAGLEESLQAWVDANPTRLWAFNQADVADDVVDLMESGDDETARDGTTVSTGDDPPGFDWTLGGGDELAVDQATHGHTADQPTLTQKHTLTVNDALHAHTAEQPGLNDPPFITALAGTGAESHFVDQYDNPILLRAISCWMVFNHAGRWSGTFESTVDDAIADLEAMGANALMIKTFGHTTFGSEDDTGNTHDDIAPFVGGDIGVLNEDFWERLDYFLNEAYAVGITVLVNAIHATSDLTSGGVLDPGDYDPADYEDYGAALGARYKDFPNIIWMMGGDYFDTLNSELTAFVDGLTGAGDTHLISVQNYAESTSRRILSNNGALDTGIDNADFNFVYSYNVAYDGVLHAFSESPVIPAAWMDGFYDQNNEGSRKLLRDQVWWGLTSGGRGNMYGAEAIWQWNSGAGAALGSLTFPNTDQFHMWDAFEALPNWHLLQPDTDDSLVTAGRGTPATSFTGGGGGGEYTPADAQDEYVTAAVTDDGSLAVVYFPIDTTITVDDTELPASYEVYWIDPADGTITPETPASTYAPPGLNSLGDEDYVLVFQEITNVSLTVNDALHAHTAEQPTLTQKHAIAPADAIHAHTAEQPSLTQKHVIAPADAIHAHAADSPDLSESGSLAVDQATHAHTADQPTLTQKHTLTVNDALHGHTAEQPTVTPGGEAGSPLRRWNGSAFIEGGTLMRWNGSAFVAGGTMRRWNGSAFVPAP